MSTRIAGQLIRRRKGSVWILWLLGLCIALAPAVATADDGASDEDRQMEGLVELRSANDAFDEEDFDSAYEHYVNAFELLEEPMIKYRMGQTAEKIGKVDEAIAHYEAYKEIGDDAEFLGRIERALPRLRGEGPATVDINSNPPGATVILVDLLDGSEDSVARTPATVDVQPGLQEVRLRMDGYEEAVFDEELAAGGQHVWEIVMQQDEAQLQALQVDPDADDDGSSLTLWGWTSTGLGAGILALGGVMTYLQIDTTNQVNDFDRAAAGQEATTQEERNTLRAQQESLRNDAETYHTVALASYAAGGALLATGLGILIFDSQRGGDSDEAGLGMRLGFSPDGGFVGIGGEF